MKNHWSFKLIALIVAAVSGFTLTVSGLSVFINWNWGLYQNDPQQIIAGEQQETLDYWGYNAAKSIVADYLMEANTLPGSSARELWENVFDAGWHYYDSTDFTYAIYQGNKLLSTNRGSNDYAQVLTIPLSMETGKVVYLGKSGDFPRYEELTEDYVWQTSTGAPVEAPSQDTLYYELTLWYDDNYYRVDRYQDAAFTAKLYLTQEAVTDIIQDVYQVNLMKVTYSLRQYDIAAVAVSLLILLFAVLYLCFASGKKPGTDGICPRGLNALPLDLASIAALSGGATLILVADECVGQACNAGTIEAAWIYLACAGGAGMAAILVCAMLLTALCAQVRLGRWQWFKRTVVGRICRGIWGWFGLGVRKVASESEKRGLGRKAGTVIRSVYQNMPLNWQWLAVYGGLMLLLLWVQSLFRYSYCLPATLLLAVLGIPIVLYTAHGFGKLRDAARRMSQGDLDTKIDTRQDILYGSFAEFAADLNALGDACTVAAQEKMKSERMKSELITNVSHDIKTPLTSIINYVDLLQMAATEEQRREYLEVLNRQSQRLKKLIEDLMEMSKANSGNIAVELQSTDVIEAVNQALGEFADALQARNLTVIFRPQGSLMASCDGKLLWRVMSNVLGNVVKYALPGTRVYCDVTADGRKARISVKNISRDPLNITADELMERFVRGDQSRNSEGNGLGLNIAKSLMEVQGGDLELTIDGDLFKVTLTLNQN